MRLEVLPVQGIGDVRPGDDGILDGWLVDSSDAGTIVPGVEVRDCPLWMSDESATVAMVRRALELAEEVR